MKKPKRAGTVLIAMGAVLILAALLLSLYNSQIDRCAGQKSALLMEEIQAAIPSPEESAERMEQIASDNAEAEEIIPEELPVVWIDGYACIGYLSIPVLSLELPVMAEWDYSRLKVAPCRQFGSSRTNDLVIAAHNYKSHFGKLSELEIGEEILFIDMDGIVNRYSLRKLETVKPENVAAVQNSGYDLVLYTCTPGGAARVAAFCDRVTDEMNGVV